MTDPRPISLSTTIRVPAGLSHAQRAQIRSAAYDALKRYVLTCVSDRALSANVPRVMYGSATVVVTCTWPEHYGGKERAAELLVLAAINALELPCTSHA